MLDSIDFRFRMTVDAVSSFHIFSIPICVSKFYSSTLCTPGNTLAEKTFLSDIAHTVKIKFL